MFNAETDRIVKYYFVRSIPPIAVSVVFSLLLICLFWPQIDLVVSGWLYRPQEGFYLAFQPVLLGLHWLAVKGAWFLGTFLLLATLTAYVTRKTFLTLTGKNWLFLFLALMIGPVLVANVGLKDNWGRARPRDVTEFGGASLFSPALEPQKIIRKNSSFVSGDASFGFFLPCFAYVVPRRHSRKVFWSLVAFGSCFGFARIAMGAHFLSDTLFAAFFMLSVSALVHAAMFKGSHTVAYWRDWLCDGKK